MPVAPRPSQGQKAHLPCRLARTPDAREANRSHARVEPRAGLAACCPLAPRARSSVPEKLGPQVEPRRLR